MADAANPNSIWGPNEYPNMNGAGTAPAIGLTLEPGGNTVDRNRIPKTINVVDTNGTPAKPGGQPGTTGY